MHIIEMNRSSDISGDHWSDLISSGIAEKMRTLLFLNLQRGAEFDDAPGGGYR